MIRLTYERRQQLADALWGAVLVAATVVLTAVALWLVAAMAVGSVALARWLEGIA